jgi:hypothetical protein
MAHKETNMIETLETRRFLSATPATLVALRADMVNLSRPLPYVLNTYITVFDEVVASLEIFNAPKTVGPLENQLHVFFNYYLHQLAMDVTNVKTLMNQDSIRLAEAVQFEVTHPGNTKAPTLVGDDESILTAQASAGVAALKTDCNDLIGVSAYAINKIVAAYPIDATPASETAVLTSAIATATSQIESTMNQLANTDTPAFIAAIVPASTPAA